MGEAADFFVSYTGADRAWAEWIAWQLEAEGYTAVVQAWDFGPGRDWAHEMQQATQRPSGGGGAVGRLPRVRPRGGRMAGLLRQGPHRRARAAAPGAGGGGGAAGAAHDRSMSTWSAGTRTAPGRRCWLRRRGRAGSRPRRRRSLATDGLRSAPRGAPLSWGATPGLERPLPSQPLLHRPRPAPGRAAHPADRTRPGGPAGGADGLGGVGKTAACGGVRLPAAGRLRSGLVGAAASSRASLLADTPPWPASPWPRP